MPFLTDTEKTQIREAIKQVEAGTDAEIVTVIAEQSDGYRYIPMLWAALLALSLPGIYYAWEALTLRGWTQAPANELFSNTLYPIQVLVFLGIGALFQFPAIRLCLIPRSVKLRRASRQAREQFFLQNLHETRQRTGILIFVSVAEHYVEILPDIGVSAKVDQDAWQHAVDGFVIAVKRGEIAAGFMQAIEQCKDITWQHFPLTNKSVDELPNHLIEIDGDV